MQEGIVLKKRFDDVFESTRYTKALEALSKTKKEVQSKAKDLKGELMEFGAHLQSAVQSQKELEACTENQENCKEELDRLATEIDANQERVCNPICCPAFSPASYVDPVPGDSSAQLTRCSEVMDGIRVSAGQVQQLEWQVQEAERRVLEKRQSLESTLTASDAELKRDIADFDNVVRTRTQELQAQQRAVSTLNAEIARLRERIDALNLKRGQVELLQDQSRQLKEQQAQNGAFLQRKYALPALPVTGAGNAGWGANVIRTFVTNLGNEVRSSAR